MWAFSLLHWISSVIRVQWWLIFKEFFNPAVNWLDFYNLMSGYVGIACSVAFIGSAVCLIQRYRREKYAEVSGEELDTPHPAGGLSGKRCLLYTSRCV